MNIYRFVRSIAALSAACGLYVAVNAESLYLEDFNFSAGNTQGSDILSVRWGIWDGTTFVQAITSINNSGYVDVAAPELVVSLNQTSNDVYLQGAQMALAVFTDGSSDAQSLNWTGATHGVVLVDSSWMAPAFNNNITQVSFSFTSSTSAVLGSFAFNGGNEVIGLTSVSAVPEPSTFAMLFGVAALGMAGCRRRRHAS